MRSNERYVIQSLELHLFFARIMKEHSFFLEAGFTPRDSVFSKEADDFKLQFETILLNAIQVSNGVIGNDVLTSGEIITDFTLDAEKKTESLTGISINQKLTLLEAKLCGSNGCPNISQAYVEYVRELNCYAKIAVEGLITFKEKILNCVLSCRMFTVNYPLLIEHILREARLYQRYLIQLDCGKDIENDDIRETELFWDQIMMEHALFIRGLLDPTEGELINTANDFAGDYAALLERARNASDLTIDSVTNDTLQETIKYRDFKAAGTEGIADCKIRSIIVPLLADHVLREANHYLRLLKDS